MTRPLDFQSERDEATRSWERADPRTALIESFGKFGFRVFLRDGSEAHHCVLGLDDGEYHGQCDCKGFEYHNGACAHLCTIRKADFVGDVTVNHADADLESEHEFSQVTGRCFEEEHDRGGPTATRAHTRARPHTFCRDGGCVSHPYQIGRRPSYDTIDSVNTKSADQRGVDG